MIRAMLFAAFVAASVAMPLSALADPPAGQIDPTFGSFDGGVAGLQLEGFDLGGELNDAAYAMAEDSQGRLLLAGVGETDNGACLGVMRFTPDGQLDKNDFGHDQNGIAKGKICHLILSSDISLLFDMDIALLSDGGFLIGGIANSVPFVCRFHANGDRWLDFGTAGCITLAQVDTGGSWPAPDVLVSGGSVLVVANTTSANNKDTPVLSRIALDSGDLQPFGQQAFIPLLSGTEDAFAWDALLTDDGALMLAGHIVEDADDVDAFVARFDLQEQLPDSAFAGDGIIRFKFNQTPLGQDYLKAIAALPNGNLLVAGNIEMPDRTGLAIIEFDPETGDLSPTFNGGLPGVYDPCSAVDGGCNLTAHRLAITDKHIVIAGDADNSALVVRLDRNGTVDHDFGDGGIARFDFLEETTGLVLQGERIVMSSYSKDDPSDFALLRLSDGRLFKDQFEIQAP